MSKQSVKQIMKGVFDALLAVSVFWACGFLGNASYSLFGSPFVYSLIAMAGIGFVAGSYLRIGIKAVKDGDLLQVARAMIFFPSFFIWSKLLTGVLHLNYPISNVQSSDAGGFIGYSGTLLALAISPLIFAKKNLKTIARLARFNSK